jgi:hypothetical protein
VPYVTDFSSTVSSNHFSSLHSWTPLHLLASGSVAIQVDAPISIKNAVPSRCKLSRPVQTMFGCTESDATVALRSLGLRMIH